MKEILNLVHLAENLKKEKRHSWLSNHDQESVAEHSWRLALMVVLIAPRLEKPVSIEKALKMAIIHDLPEAVVGDTPDFEAKDKNQVELKHQKEKEAFLEISSKIDRSDLFEIWQEFEKKETIESKLVQALDRLELQIQHNESDISTWLDIEKKRQYVGYESYCKHDQTLKVFSQLCAKESKDKLSEEDLDEVLKWLDKQSENQVLKEIAIKGNVCAQSETSNH